MIMNRMYSFKSVVKNWSLFIYLTKFKSIISDLSYIQQFISSKETHKQNIGMSINKYKISLPVDNLDYSVVCKRFGLLNSSFLGLHYMLFSGGTILSSCNIRRRNTIFCSSCLLSFSIIGIA